MDEQQQTTPSGRVGQLKRRGLIAAAAALGAAWLARLAEAAHEPTETTYDGQHVMHVDQFNTTAGLTAIRRSGGSGLMAFFVDNTANGGDGILSEGRGEGFAGASAQNNSPASSLTGTGGFGVVGQNASSSATANGIGVFGIVSAASSVGVRGLNFASSPSAVAVQGLSGNTGTGPGIGVHGKSAGIGVEGDSTNSVGVIGRATAAGNPNPGIIGSATNGYGVFGFSANSNGIAGQSGTSAAGCVGFAGAAGGYGIYGGTAVQGGTPAGSLARCWWWATSPPPGAPSRPPSRIRMGRTDACTAWRARRAGSKISGKADWPTVGARSSWMPTFRPWSTGTTTTSS